MFAVERGLDVFGTIITEVARIKKQGLKILYNAMKRQKGSRLVSLQVKMSFVMSGMLQRWRIRRPKSQALRSCPMKVPRTP